MNKKKLFFVTSEMSANFFLIPYAEYLQRHFDIVVITNSKKINIKKKYKTKISIKTFLFDRDINLFKDLKFLWYLYRYFKKEKPHIVHTITQSVDLLEYLQHGFQMYQSEFIRSQVKFGY